MAERRNPQLNLQPELPEVVSRDFNLFYKPEPKPEIAGVKELTDSLDRFVNDGGTKLVLSKEKEVKAESEAEAIEVYNNTRLKFNDLVNNGKLPKEANPYFIDKYKELELGDKSREFETILKNNYIDKGVKEDTRPEAFNQFYNDTLKEFFSSNQLGLYEPAILANSFFKKTDAIRNNLFTQHSNSQMAQLGENYKKSFKNNIQGFFIDDGSPDNFKNIGANISAFIKDKTANGLSNGSAQEYLLDALTEFVQNTDDIDFARSILNEVPKHIILGTDSLSNVVGLQDEFNKIDDALLDREIDLEDRAVKKSNVQFSKEKRFVRARLDDPEFDILEFKQGSEYKSLSRRGKAFVDEYYKKGTSAFSANDNREVRGKLDELIKNNQFEEAEQYLLEVGSGQLREGTYKDYWNKITVYEATQRDGLLNNETFNIFKGRIDERLKAINKSGIIVDPYLTNKFDEYARQWLVDNKEKYPNRSELEDAFEKALAEKYTFYEGILAGSGATASNKKEQFNPDKINLDTNNNEEPVETKTVSVGNKKNRRKTVVVKPDPELSIDLSKVVIIPEGLQGSALRKFRRDNPEALSQEEYDRIASKQTKNNLAKSATTDGGST